jgi:uncharacterized protein YjbI with pentapeptide repeats
MTRIANAARLLLVLAAMVFAAVATAHAVAAGPRPHVSGSTIVRDLAAGETVSKSGVVVDGPLEIKKHIVSGLFRCRKCVFNGRVSAPDVTFARTVDLSGSAFRGPVDFSGTTFRAPALFRAATDDVGQLNARAPSKDFSLAEFNDFADFKDANFTGAASFEEARFADATFTNASLGAASFDGALFAGPARFSGVTFTSGASFDEADFGDRADFSGASFHAGAGFTNAHFAQGASFLGAGFTPALGAEAARFDSVTSTGDLDLTYSQFNATAKPDVVAVFADLVSSGALVLTDAEFPAADRLVMDRLTVHELIMNIEDVRLVDGRDEQKRVLETIENTAKARNDLKVANDAHYQLRVLDSQSYGPVGHALDYVFYRGIAGYLVRPFRPILALLVLALVISIYREVRRRQPDGNMRLVRSAQARGAGFLTSFLDSLAKIGPRRGEGDPPLPERLEVFAYRLLAVCALLALANSNPTLRQMVDTLF